MLLMATAVFSTSCENDNINPYDYVNNNNQDNNNQGSTDVIRTSFAEYPIGSLVWTKDTTLTESIEIPEGTSLYIEPGVTVTCKAEVQVPIEIVVLGNLYCMGTAEKPVVFTSDDKKPEAWGGIICGYNSEEVVLNHVEIAYAGATPTENSISFQRKLFKTTIDGGVPAFHFCNVNGKFVIANSFFHDAYNDLTYFTGGNAVIVNSIFADCGNKTDGGEAAIGSLSGGNQQKVVIGKMLATEPEVILLDEPSRGIDIGAKAEVFKLLAEKAKQGLAVVYTTSEVGECLSIAHRIIVMHRGRISAEFGSDVSKEKIMAASGEAMVGH